MWWFAFVMIAIVMAGAIDDNQEKKVIQICIEQGKQAIIERGNLKECR